MSSQIDYRHSSTFPAAAVYRALVDPAYLRARLAELGGAEAGIVSHRADEHGAAFTLRHELDANDLPRAIRSFLTSRLVLERTEAWTLGADGRDGTVNVQVIGAPVPATADGRLGVADIPGAGSEYRVLAGVTVSVPLFGASVEEFVAEKVRELLDLEARFTDRWLKQRAA
ncbi:MAG: DUF2505 domain-containing protein [Pseudonocardia sp.]|nr:DUF2505 domain-containing protein [Pseudonocardia sp.]